MNDILSIVVAGIFSCIILDILGYLLKLIGIPEPSWGIVGRWTYYCLLYTSPSPRDVEESRMPSSA